MATIPLRSYNREIEGLIDRAQIDEVVAHCLHILQSFPKHIATYRLLGKAYLEIQRYSDASDIFQRILSSVPDDFVSNVGMSIIREDESNLDAAIWHMERAFEAQPANAAIQDELRRLYGRRDGLEPPKVRLTRAALARMYAKGHLYQQAIGELRAALAEDPQRTDLQVLLAQMYFSAGLKVDAVNSASNLLKKLPFCLEANRILAAILPDTERAEDALIYKQQTISMDPYYQFSPAGSNSSDNVPDEAVSIPKLAYEPGTTLAGKAGQPAWAASLGVQVGDQQPATLPDWLSGEQEDITQLRSNAFVWDESKEEHPEKETPAQAETLQNDEEMIPDWMKDAGWQPSDGSVSEAPAETGVEELGYEEEASLNGALASADIPDWLRDIAPEGALEQPIEEQTFSDELPSWLQETPPGASDSVVTWLGVTQPEEPQPEEVPDQVKQVSLPDWESELQSEQPQTMEDFSSIQALPPLDEPMVQEIPDWLQEFSPKPGSKPADIEEMPTVIQSASLVDKELGITDFLKNVDLPTASEGAVEEPEAILPTEDIPDWLKELEVEQTGKDFSFADTVISAKPVLDQEIPATIQQAEPSAEIDFSDDEAALAWLEGLAAKQDLISQQPPVLSVEPVVEPEPEEVGPIAEPEAVVLPDWLLEIEKEAEPVLEITEPPASKAESVISGADVNLEDGEAALAWLEGLAAKQGVPEDQLTTPVEDRLEAPPDWLLEEPLKEETISEEIPAKAETEELPVWLLESEDQELAVQPILAGEAEEAEVVSEPTLVGDINLADEDAALAWLESLAAKQGVPEEQLTVPPEQRLEAPPDWLQTTIEPGKEEAVQEIEEPAAQEPEEAPLPDWLMDFEVEEEPEPITAESPLPVWLRESEDFRGEEEVPASELGELMEKALAETFISKKPEIIQKLDLNNASLSDLEDLPGIGFVLAQSILSYRDINGPLSSVDELTNVNGISDEMVNELRDLVEVKILAAKKPFEERLIEAKDEDERMLVSARSAMLANEIGAATEQYEGLVKKGLYLPEIILDLQESLYRQSSVFAIWQLLGDAYVRSDQLDAALDAYIKAEELLS